MKADYDAKLAADIPGENWDGVIIDCYGNGIDNLMRHGEPTRISCYAKNGEGLPTLRTSLDVPLKLGMMAWIREQNTHYLFLSRPQKSVNCYSVPATACNKEVTFYKVEQPKVDQYGYSLEGTPGTPQHVDIVRDMPCVVKHEQSVNNERNMPGLIVGDVLTIKLQANYHTAVIDIGTKFTIDRQEYTVIDAMTEDTS